MHARARAGGSLIALISRLAPLALLAAMPSALGAQELRGLLTAAEGGPPPPGLLVEATSVASGAVVGRTLSDAAGRFRLALPADTTVLLRALRIGHRPTLLDTLRLAPGEVREGHWPLTGAVIALARVEVVGRDVCRLERAEGALIVTLLEEVWKAVRATQVRGLDAPLTAEWALLAQQTTLDGRPLGVRTEQVYTSATDRPFVSRPPDSLAAAGYLAVSDDGYQLFAPDADVLLSAQFLDGHCFRPEPWRGDDRDWVGLGFRPRERRRGVVGIEGTLWLDRASAELRRLEFRYVNLPHELATRAAGGEVEFLRLPTGAWLVERWEIRMPRAAEAYVHRPGLSALRTPQRTLRVTSLEVAGGAVRAVYAGAQALYRAGEGVVPELASADRAARAAPALTVDDAAALCADTVAARSGVLWGVAPGLAAQPGAALHLAWTDERRWFDAARRAQRRAEAVVGVATSGLWVACGLPADELIELRVVAGADTLGPARAAVIPAGVRGLQLPLTVRAAAGDEVVGAADAAQVRGTVFGRFVDSLGVVSAASAVTLRVLGDTARARPSPDGGFALDALAPGEYGVVAWDERFALLGVPTPTARVRVGPDGSAEAAFLATPSRATYFAAHCGRPPAEGEGLLMGRLQDAMGAPRAGLRVQATWTRSLLRRDGIQHTPQAVTALSDAEGRYLLCGVPAGEGLASDGREAVTTGPVTLVAGAASGAPGDGERGAAVPAALAAGPVTLAADTAWMRRRDLVVGRATARTRLAGRVLDPLGRPLAGATVLVPGADSLATRSAESGAWVLDGVPLRSLQLTVRALGYLPVDLTLDPEGGRLVAGDLRLEPLPQYLEAVVVRGVRVPTSEAAFEDRRRSLAFGTFIDQEMIRRQPRVTPDFLSSRIPRSAVRSGTILLSLPSGFDAMAECPPLWFVDGINYGRATQRGEFRAGAIAHMQDEVLQHALRIEVYRASLSPPEFIDLQGCGAVLVWTR